MTVDSTIEHGSGILADTRVDHCTTTGVLAEERGDIVDDTSNADKGTAVFALVNVIIPLHDGELVKRNAPVEGGSFLVELLLELLDTTLFDFVGAELLEVGGKTELLPDPDVPLSGVILVPLNGVAVV